MKPFPTTLLTNYQCHFFSALLTLTPYPQSIVILPGFCVCKFTYLLKFITPKSMIAALVRLFTNTHGVVKYVNHPTCMFIQLTSNKAMICLLVSALIL